MKKTLLKQLFVILLMLYAPTAIAEEIEVNGICYNITSPTEKTAEVTYGKEYTDIIEIPSTITYNGSTYSVTAIGADAFEECTGLEKITIPNSIISIGENAFCGCTGLKSIEIPNSVTSIEYTAFYDCSGLTSVTIGSNVKSIGDLAFYGCPAIENISVNANNKYFDNRNNCNAVIEKASNTLILGCKNTIIPNGIKSIGEFSFYKCAIKEVTIPEGVEDIKEGAFAFCPELTSVKIPSSIKNIEDGAFYECPALKDFISGIPAEKLFGINESIFGYTDKSVCTLYVPKGSKAAYAECDGWKEFQNIKEFEETSITGIRETCGERIIYDINGRKVKNPTKGIYIINGEKVLIH
ncbi:MAG: leucine-rich repeat domain-containing protein [Bacteroidaceae bacterium]|nr:leucine-rich repeat domain-containing protein [Bacteroidaceae bacterium]